MPRQRVYNKTPFQVLLFGKKLPDGETLFVNQVKLRDNMAILGGDFTLSHISRVLRGNIPCNESLKKFLFLAIEDRLKDLGSKVVARYQKNTERILERTFHAPQVHIEAVAAQKKPNQKMFCLLRALECWAGFPLSMETCLAILSDLKLSQKTKTAD